jgi:hypothetical protein
VGAAAEPEEQAVVLAQAEGQERAVQRRAAESVMERVMVKATAWVEALPALAGVMWT